MAGSGVRRAGWQSRRARASAERGRVQGPGRAEADFGPRTSRPRYCILQFQAALQDALLRFLSPLDSPGSVPVRVP